MVSIELLRCYPFFAGLSMDELGVLAKAADELTVETGQRLFREGEIMDHIYLVREGVVEIVFEVPDRNREHKLADQFNRDLQTMDVVVSAVGPGEVFGWSGLIPPHEATASAKTMTPCKIIAIDCRKLRAVFEDDCHFGYLMTLKAAQVIGKRLRDLRIESLTHLVEPARPVA